MHRRVLLLTGFTVLAGLGALAHSRTGPASAAAAIATLRAATPPARSGTLPDRWNAGVDCANEPEFQVHRYDEDTYVLRLSKCVHFEAPFLYLLFGDGIALLMDTGSSPNADVYGTVRRVMFDWSRTKGVAMPDLIVAHTHSHGDHIAGDAQFIGAPGVVHVVGWNNAAVRQFWGFQNWPHDRPTFDLGGRILDVIATPGHQAQSVTLYDRETQLLLTGDIVYPGHLFVFSAGGWSQFEASIGRLVEFARENPVRWMLGCHIETSDAPFTPYAWGTNVHPNERRLEFLPSKLTDIQRAAESMEGDPECTVFEDFVIHPVYKCFITWNG